MRVCTHSLDFDRIERLIERQDSTNKIGLGLIFGSFIVNRVDMRAADLKMDTIRNETKADMRAADLKMDTIRIAADLKMDTIRIAADLKMDTIRNETKADMERMRTETRLYNTLTLVVALSAIAFPIFLKTN